MTEVPNAKPDAPAPKRTDLPDDTAQYRRFNPAPKPEPKRKPARKGAK